MDGNRDLQAEFSRVSESAVALLRDGRHRGKPARRLLQFLIIPAFDDPYAWDVVEVGRRDKMRYELVHASWLRNLDRGAFVTPAERAEHPRPFVPTMNVRSVHVEKELIDGFMARIGQMAVPLSVADGMMGFDGVSYELAIGELFCSARITWWVQMPSSWSRLQPLLDELVSHFRSLLSDEPFL
jgi:hypothetical protein